MTTPPPLLGINKYAAAHKTSTIKTFLYKETTQKLHIILILKRAQDLPKLPKTSQKLPIKPLSSFIQTSFKLRFSSLSNVAFVSRFYFFLPGRYNLQALRGSLPLTL
jgi:hypothetical protein